jgi:hypothetical protein
MFATAIFESIYFDFANQNTRSMPFHIQIETTHYSEMNDKIFDI